MDVYVIFIVKSDHNLPLIYGLYPSISLAELCLPSLYDQNIIKRVIHKLPLRAFNSQKNVNNLLKSVATDSPLPHYPHKPLNITFVDENGLEIIEEVGIFAFDEEET